MIPMQIIRKYAQEIQGPELDLLLLNLYRTSWEHRPGGIDDFFDLNFEQRIKHFQNWLQQMWNYDDQKLDNPKVREAFARELPELREIWEEVTQPTGEQEVQKLPWEEEDMATGIPGTADQG